MDMDLPEDPAWVSNPISRGPPAGQHGAAGANQPSQSPQLSPQAHMTDAVRQSSVQQAILKGMASHQMGAPGSLGTALAAGMRTGARRASISVKMSTWVKERQQRRQEHGVDMAVVKAMPVREALQGLFSVAREKSLRDAFMFFCIAALFVTITYLVHDSHEAFLTTAAVNNIYTDQEFTNATYKKNFYEIQSHSEFWEWVMGPLHDGIFVDSQDNGDPLPINQTGYVSDYQRIVGAVQFRQMRTGNSSCYERRFLSDNVVLQGKTFGRYDSTDGTCFSEFDLSNPNGSDTKPFGPGGRYTWSNGHSELQGLYGFGPNYGNGGYVVEVPLDPVAGPAMLQQLFDDKWTDRSTRAVSVGVNLYDTNTRLVTVCRMVVEITPSGHFTMFAKLYPFRLAVYVGGDKSDYVHAVMEGLYGLLIIYFLQKEFRRCKNSRPMLRYFSHPTNVFEVLLVLMNAIYYYQWFRFLLDDKRTSFSVNATRFIDLFDLAEKYMDVFTTAAFLGLMYSIKTFRYFSISKKLSTLWLTLERAGPDLAAFLVGFLIVVVGFSLFGFFSFGFLLPSFHSISASFSTLLRFPLGDFDYNDLISARPKLSPVFFSLYVSIVYFVMMNIVIAIVTRYFEEVHSEAVSLDRWKHSATSVEGDIYGWFQLKLGGMRDMLCPRFQPSGGFHESGEGNLFDAANRQDFIRRRNLQMQLHNLMRLAKLHHSVDLYRYFERIYSERGPNTVYVGVHELCALSRPVPCEAGTHKNCEAHKLLSAYTSVKSVLLVGRAKQHTPLSSLARIDPASNKYRVYKLNRHGMMQRRVVVIHANAQCLFTYTSTRLTVRTRLFLSGLCQIESGTQDQLLLRLQFVNQRPAGQQRGKRERLLALRFLSHESKKAFIQELTSSLDAYLQAHEDDGMQAKALHQFEKIVESMEHGRHPEGAE